MAKVKSQAMTWKEIVADAIRELGGEAHLSNINRIVRGHPKTKKNPTWKDTIRRVVREYAIFEPVPPARSGVYKLLERETPQPKEQKFDSRDTEIDHSIAQGMLVSLGKVYGYDTFVPTHDQTARTFQGQKLADLVSIRSCNDIFRGPNLRKIREVDVLWFSEDEEGPYPVYAFEVEHTTKVRNGLDRLLKIPRRYSASLFIIGPGEEEKKLFEGLIEQTPFRGFRDKFTFQPYPSLQAIYNAAITHHEERESFGLVERYHLP